MRQFYSALASYNTTRPHKHVVYVPYDQLTDQIGPLADLPPEETTIIMIESLWKGKRRSYHQQKLATVLANSRCFALEQAQRGVQVLYRYCNTPFATELRQTMLEHNIATVTVMEPAERELRQDLHRLVRRGKVNIVSHEGWLTTQTDLLNTRPKPPWRMDAFYQHLRKKTGLLVESDKQIGGKYSFGAENRKPWKTTPSPPDFPVFPTNPIKEEVRETIEAHFADHPGTLSLDNLPCTKQDALTLWKWACETCLHNFGRSKDAMSTKSASPFHNLISPLLNLHRLLPANLVRDVHRLDIPLKSKEGFIRQVLGWREFVHHIHRITDGFRHLDTDSGTKTFGVVPSTGKENIDRGSLINELHAHQPLPDAFWGKDSGLHCLDQVVQEVMAEGYTPHISRLMILANLATLMEIRPREITDWFWVSFIDAYDWVVEPNVLAMGTFATGEVLSTKPHVSNANYINKRSNLCTECSFDPKKDCPVTNLYWRFLVKHHDRFSNNFRMKMALSTARRRSPEKREMDQLIFEWLHEHLKRGKAIRRQNLPIMQGSACAK